jgi:hypothetical protein
LRKALTVTVNVGGFFSMHSISHKAWILKTNDKEEDIIGNGAVSMFRIRQFIETIEKFIRT